MKLKHTPEEIKKQIAVLPSFTDELLVHYLKIISSMQTKAEKQLYEPLVKAINAERKARGIIRTISSKPITPKATTKSGAKPEE